MRRHLVQMFLDAIAEIVGCIRRKLAMDEAR